MSIHDVVEDEHARLKKYERMLEARDDTATSLPDPNPHTFNLQILTMCAQMISCMPRPPKCRTCGEFRCGNNHHPARMAKQRMGLCTHHNWDATLQSPIKLFLSGLVVNDIALQKAHMGRKAARN